LKKQHWARKKTKTRERERGGRLVWFSLVVVWLFG
jgi:hypothetical protein